MILTASSQMGALDSRASQRSSDLSVFLRHHEGHKLLLKHDTVYYPDNNLLIEIPLATLPQGKEFVVKVIAEDGEASYESREFLIYLP
jgi:hypothetical protein